MSFFKQTTLIGIGLIGSSIARIIKKKKLSKKIMKTEKLAIDGGKPVRQKPLPSRRIFLWVLSFS